MVGVSGNGDSIVTTVVLIWKIVVIHLLINDPLRPVTPPVIPPFLTAWLHLMPHLLLYLPHTLFGVNPVFLTRSFIAVSFKLALTFPAYGKFATGRGFSPPVLVLSRSFSCNRRFFPIVLTQKKTVHSLHIAAHSPGQKSPKAITPSRTPRPSVPPLGKFPQPGGECGLLFAG